MLIVRNSRVPGWIRWLDVGAITIGPVVFIGPGHASDRIIHHEAIHVAQGRELLFIFFWLAYGYFFLKGRASGLSVREAYLAIPFEQEARAHEADLYYLSLREPFAWWNFRA